MTDQSQGNSAPEAEQSNDDAPNYVTSEQLNRAITARFRSFENKLDGRLGQITASLETLTSNAQPTSENNDEAPAEGDGSNAQLVAMKNKLDNMSKKLEAKEQEAEMERQKQRSNSLRVAVRDALAAVGIDGTRGKQALGYLVDTESRVLWDGDELAFRDNDGLNVSLSDGLKAWARTDDAKTYLPPRGVHGSGDIPRTGEPPNNDPAARRRTAESIIANAMLGRN